jgi:hypothetical protein
VGPTCQRGRPRAPDAVSPRRREQGRRSPGRCTQGRRARAGPPGAAASRAAGAQAAAPKAGELGQAPPGAAAPRAAVAIAALPLCALAHILLPCARHRPPSSLCARPGRVDAAAVVAQAPVPPDWRRRQSGTAAPEHSPIGKSHHGDR